jgi:hypothetical protein
VKSNMATDDVPINLWTLSGKTAQRRLRCAPQEVPIYVTARSKEDH